MVITNKVICGDAQQVLKQFEPRSIDMCFTSPSPLDFNDNGNSSNTSFGKAKTEYVQQLVTIFNELKRVLKDTGSLFIQIGDYHYQGTLSGIPELLVLTMINDGWFLRSKLIWHRTEKSYLEETNRFARNWEYLFFFTKNPSSYYFNTKGNKYYMNSVYSFPCRLDKVGNTFDSGFPNELIEIAIKTTIPPEGIVIDIMAGTGETGLVAKRLGRKFVMIDIDEGLCSAMKTRLGV